MQHLSGRTVTITRRVQNGKDEFNAPKFNDVVETIANVLIEPLSSEELYRNMQNGVRISLRLHFPKTFTASLNGSIVTVLAHKYRVVGDPQSYQEEMCPGQWSRVVDVVEVDG